MNNNNKKYFPLLKIICVILEKLSAATQISSSGKINNYFLIINARLETAKPDKNKQRIFPREYPLLHCINCRYSGFGGGGRTCFFAGGELLAQGSFQGFDTVPTFLYHSLSHPLQPCRIQPEEGKQQNSKAPKRRPSITKKR